MNRHFFSITVIGLLTVGLFQLFTATLSLDRLRNLDRLLNLDNATLTLAKPAQAEAAQTDATQDAGEYSGQVKLHWSLGGVYSDTLATPTPPPTGATAPPDLGSIDLVLQVNQTGNTLSGYVVLTNTLVFTRQHTITPPAGGSPIDIGPTLQGSFDGVNLTLLSEPFALKVAGRPVTRQFRLVGAVVPGDGSTITGEYRETLWGYTPQPITAVGTFTLQRTLFTPQLVAPPTGSNNAVYLPVIWR